MIRCNFYFSLKWHQQAECQLLYKQNISISFTERSMNIAVNCDVTYHVRLWFGDWPLVPYSQTTCKSWYLTCCVEETVSRNRLLSCTKRHRIICKHRDQHIKRKYISSECIPLICEKKTKQWKKLYITILKKN